MRLDTSFPSWVFRIIDDARFVATPIELMKINSCIQDADMLLLYSLTSENKMQFTDYILPDR